MSPIRYLIPHETHHWGYFPRTKPSNEDFFFERRKVLNCSNAFVVAVCCKHCDKMLNTGIFEGLVL